MSRFKVLITGKNESFIDELFALKSEDLEFVTCSGRTADIVAHIDSFYPNVFLYCPKNDSPDIIQAISDARESLADADVRVAVAGTPGEVCDFSNTCSGMVDGAFGNPKSAEFLADLLIRVANGEKFEAPAAPAAATEPEDVDALLASLAAEKKHILIVDDDPIMLKTIQNALDGEYNVATAVNGKIALKFLEKKSTDMILLDYEMPLMSGPEVFAEIRKNPQWEKLPVVFLTGVSDSASIKKVLSLGPQGYLLKPVDKERLITTIKGVLK